MTKEEAESELERIKNKRGEIVTNFAYIELIIKNICSVYYLGKIDQNFRAEVLEDEYFSFALLRNIFEKVLKKYPDIDFPMGKLRELSKLRNIIAHAQVTATAIVNDPAVPSASIQKMVFKHSGIVRDTDETFSKYDELKSTIQEKLKQIPGGDQVKVSL